MPGTAFRLLSLLALVVTGLSAPSFLAPATAFEPPCVVTTSNTTDIPFQDAGLLSFRYPIESSLTVPDAGVVRDIDVTIDIAHASASDVRVSVIHGETGVGVINSAHPGANFTGTHFDDEAALELSGGTAPYTGAFRPDAPLSTFDTLPAQGIWTLSVVDDVRNQTAGTLLGWSISVRYADCDFDGDGLKDEVDNCPDDADASQTNTDGDANGGDACDTDDDNDGLLDSADNCRTVVNPDQTNNEGDSLGDICDSDDDNDLRLDSKDSCDFMYAKTVSGCPSAKRTLTLSYSAGAFRGKLRAPGVQRCYAYRKVQIWRVVSGPDVRLAIRETEIDGTYSGARSRRPGTYYAIAVRGAIANVAECARAKSALLTLR